LAPGIAFASFLFCTFSSVRPRSHFSFTTAFGLPYLDWATTQLSSLFFFYFLFGSRKVVKRFFGPGQMRCRLRNRTLAIPKNIPRVCFNISVQATNAAYAQFG